MTVRSIHPGIGENALRAETGFDLGDLSEVPRTPDPSAEQLDILRRKVDPRSHLLPDIGD
jgi:glutaconate CoA-transferase subunit B